MALILETKDFIVDAHERAHHSRENGGHIVVWPKRDVEHLSDMSLGIATAFIHLTMVVGEAFLNVAKSNGLKAVRVNFQSNGNWTYKNEHPEPKTHMNLYLRTWGEKHPGKDPRFQAFPEALVFPDRSTGFYEHFTPLTADEGVQIKNEILRLLSTDAYKHVAFQL